MPLEINPSEIEALGRTLGLDLGRAERPKIYEPKPTEPLPREVGAPGSEFYERQHYLDILQPRDSKLGSHLAGDRMRSAEKLAVAHTSKHLGRPASIEEAQHFLSQKGTSIPNLADLFSGMESDRDLANTLAGLHQTTVGEMEAAIEAGKLFKEKTPAQLSSIVKQMTLAQHEAYMAGVAKAIKSNPGKIVDNAAMRSRLRVLMRDPVKHDQLLTHLEMEAEPRGMQVKPVGPRYLADTEAQTGGKQDWGKPALPVKSPDQWLKEAEKKSGGNKKIARDWLLDELDRARKAGYTRKARNLRVAISRLEGQLRRELLITFGLGAGVGGAAGAGAYYLANRGQQ